MLDEHHRWEKKLQIEVAVIVKSYLDPCQVLIHLNKLKKNTVN